MPDPAIVFRDNGQNWFFSWLHSFPPVTHAFPRSIELPGWDCSVLVANGVDRDDPVILHEEPQYARVEFTDVAQLEKSVANRFGQRFPVILPVSQLRETSDDRHEVVRIARFPFVQKFSYRALPCPGFIELYRKIHSHATSILMLTWSDLQSGSEHDQDGRRAGIRLLPKLLDHVAP